MLSCRLKGIPQGYKKAYWWNTCHEFVMYTYDMIKYMLWLAAFMCVFKTKKRLTSDFGMPGGALYNLPFGMQCRDRDTDPIQFSSFQK